MKRKITYLLKDFDAMIRLFLSSTSSLEKQVVLLKNKEDIFEEIDKMCKKYDKIIDSIKQNSEIQDEI